MLAVSSTLLWISPGWAPHPFSASQAAPQLLTVKRRASTTQDLAVLIANRALWQRAQLREGRFTVPKLHSRVVAAAICASSLALAGCNSPSMEDLQRIEREVADLRTRLEAAEARASASRTSAESALDSAGQCNELCLRVSERLDELFLQTVPR
jgi:outer membrane murein-binding lipoprotein Lpp